MNTFWNWLKRAKEKNFFLTFLFLSVLGYCIGLLIGNYFSNEEDENLMLLGAISPLIILLTALDAKYPKFWVSIAIYIWFTLVIFPLLYLWLLNKSPGCFVLEKEVKEYIQSSAKSSLEAKMVDYFNQNDIKYMSLLLKSKAPILDTNIFRLGDGLHDIDTFRISLRFTKVPNQSTTLYVFNPAGRSVFSSVDYSLYLGPYAPTLKAFLKSNLKVATMELNESNAELEKINHEKYWTYSKIVFYTTNSFSPELRPKTELANVLAFFHYFVVNVVLLGIATAFGTIIITGNSQKQK